MQIIYLILFGYLLGAIPTGKIIGKIKGIDIQKKGSGNIGFANAVRVLGWKAGSIVLIGDIAKGFIPVFIARYYFDATLYQQMIIGIAPIIGHAYPVWLRFKGGKSIATGLGVLLALNVQVALAGVLLYLLVFSVSKKSAIGSLAAAWMLPIIAIYIQPNYFAYLCLLAIFATYTHRVNIKQLIHERLP